MIRAVTGAVVLAVVLAAPASGERAAPFSAPVRSLNGAGNNPAHRDWGRAKTVYRRDAAPAYADGVGAIPAGPSPRAVSDRIFDDLGQNLFSENGVTQWGWAWGQFLDHDFGLRDERPAQFEALRDGDRFFYANDSLLPAIKSRYGIDFRQSLAAIIRTNTGAITQTNVFRTADLTAVS